MNKQATIFHHQQVEQVQRPHLLFNNSIDCLLRWVFPLIHLLQETVFIIISNNILILLANFGLNCLIFVFAQKFGFYHCVLLKSLAFIIVFAALLTYSTLKIKLKGCEKLRYPKYVMN